MELKAIHDAFMQHEREDRERFDSIGGQLADIHKEQINLKDNHWAHTQKEVEMQTKAIGEMRTDLIKNTNDTGWILRIGGPILSAILVAIIGLIFLMLRKGAGL